MHAKPVTTMPARNQYTVTRIAPDYPQTRGRTTGGLLAAVASLLTATPMPVLASHIAQRIDVRDPNNFDNRVITFDDFDAAGVNYNNQASINGPSMIYVPDGTPNKLADYYLYFADHGGDHIKMAYADSPTGPFTIYQPNTGVMSLNGPNTIPVPDTRAIVVNTTQAVGDHIASPDVTFDPVAGRFNMTYHGYKYTRQPDGSYNRGTQRTFAAYSSDGLSFNDNQYGSELSAPYLREFTYNGTKYGIKDNGVQSKPDDQDIPYSGTVWLDVAFNKELKDSLAIIAADPATWADDPNNGVKNDVDFRHHAVKVDEQASTLSWWFTAKGEAPERIYEATVALDPDWTAWEVVGLKELLRPEYHYEGANQPLVPSEGGRPKVGGGDVSTAQVNELRDPAYFADPVSGREFLYYSAAGEYGIAVAELFTQAPPPPAVVTYEFDASVSPTFEEDGLNASAMTANGTADLFSGAFRSDDADPQTFIFNINVAVERLLNIDGFSLDFTAEAENYQGQVLVNGSPFGDPFTNGTTVGGVVPIQGQNVTPLADLSGIVPVSIRFDVPSMTDATVIDNFRLEGNVGFAPVDTPVSIAQFEFGGLLAPTTVADPDLAVSNMSANGTTRFEDGGFRSDDADPQVFEFEIGLVAGATLDLTGFSLDMMADSTNHVGQVKVNGIPFGDSFTNGGIDDQFISITGENVTQVLGLSGTVTIQIEFDVPQQFRDTVIDNFELFGRYNPSVPEPAGIGFTVAAALGFVRRRRAA